MGYTHYYKRQRELTDEETNDIMRDVRAVLTKNTVPLGGWDGTGEVELNDDTVRLNGVGEEGHETYRFPGDLGFDFCKTARKPYDVVVTAILICIADQTDAIDVSSDGWAEEWQDGLELAQAATGRELEIPVRADE